MSRIEHIDFLKRHIDLDRIVAISDVQFQDRDRMGSGGFMLRVEIHIQLLDAPLAHEWWGGYPGLLSWSATYKRVHSTGTWLFQQPDPLLPSVTLEEVRKQPTLWVDAYNLQEKVNALIERWKGDS